jgi:hypothetical protein
MEKVEITLDFHSKTNFGVLEGFAQGIHDQLVVMVAVYGAVTPTPLQFQSDIDALHAANGTWNAAGSHGSHDSHDVVLACAETVKEDIREIKNSVQSITPNDKVKFEALGFQTHTLGHHTAVGSMPGPTNLRVIHSHKFIQGQIKYRFAPVHGANSYTIWTGTGDTVPNIPPDPSLPFVVVNKTEFIDQGAPSGSKRWIIVGCAGASGDTGYSSLSGAVMP